MRTLMSLVLAGVLLAPASLFAAPGGIPGPLPVIPPVVPPGPTGPLPPGAEVCTGPAALHNPHCTAGHGGTAGKGGSSSGGHHLLKQIYAGIAIAYPFLVLAYYDTFNEQIEGFPGQEWNTCALPNAPAQCFEQRRVMSPWLWKAPHHEPTGRMDSFVHRFVSDGKMAAARQAELDSFYHPGR